MPTYRFNEVSVTGVRRWKDPETGKHRQQSKKFFQTINPFNTGADGQPKTYDQIMIEIETERDSWLKEKQ